jgi:outer membrane protein
MKKTLLPILLFSGLTISLVGHAQQDKWDLRRCVEYALANNISIKQADVQARLSKLTLEQSKWSQIPTLGVNGSIGRNYGRSLNQNTYTYSTLTNTYSGIGLQTNVTAFNFFSLRNSIAANKLAWQASMANTDRVKNDISLNVANAYLQVLLASEQADAARLQLKLSQNSLEITRKQVNAGTLPELNAAELESQVANDSSNLITAEGTIVLNTLQLKAYMGLDAGTPFQTDTPPVDDIPVEKVADLQPESVYSMALANQPLQKYDALMVESARKSVAANNGARYPTLSLVGNVNSNYSSLGLEAVPGTGHIRVDTFGLVYPTGDKVIVPSQVFDTRKSAYFKQIGNNFSEYIGVGLSIPILNNGILRTNYAKSKLNLRNQELQRDQDNLTLKNNIYQAYTSAMTALQKFEASKIAVSKNAKSFDYAQKRYGIGMLNTIDLLTNQNNFFKAKIDMLYAQYDYVFKMKVLEFYKGLGIRLTK